MHDLLDRLLHLDRAMLTALSRLTTPAAGPQWQELDRGARGARSQWLARRLPVTVLATLLLSLLGTMPGATAAPLGLLGAFLVAMAPLGLLAAAYRHRFGDE